MKILLMICMLLLMATFVSAGNNMTDNQLIAFLDSPDTEQAESTNIVPIVGLVALAIIIFNRKKIFKG